MGKILDRLDAAAKKKDKGEKDFLAERKEVGRWEKAEDCAECLKRASAAIKKAISEELGEPDADVNFRVHLIRRLDHQGKLEFELTISDQTGKDYRKLREFSSAEREWVEKVKSLIEKLGGAEGLTSIWKEDGDGDRGERYKLCPHETFTTHKLRDLINGLNSRLEHTINPDDIFAKGAKFTKAQPNKHGVLNL